MAINNRKSWRYLVNNYNKLVEVPGRPCPDQIKSWEKIIKKLLPLGGQALILGATPELRDLALKNNFFTWAIDYDRLMMRGMTKLMKYADAKKEKRIVADWREIKLPKNYFDLIMADASLNNVLSASGNQKVLKLIERSLKIEGICLMRNLVALSIKKPKNIEYWYNLIKNNKLKIHTDFNLIVRADSTAANFKASPQIIDSVEVYKNLLLQKNNNSKVKKFLDFYYQVVGRQRKYLFIYKKSDFEKLLKKFFNVEQIKSCRNHFCCRRVFPSYLLTKIK